LSAASDKLSLPGQAVACPHKCLVQNTTSKLVGLFSKLILLGIVYKNVRSQGSLSSADILRTRGGGSDADLRLLNCKPLKSAVLFLIVLLSC